MEDRRRHLTGLEAAQVPNIHHLELHSVNVREAPLGNPPLEGHLPALEPEADAAP
jgi:hypothetical protein